MMKKNIYNKIKYNLLTIFPLQHPKFIIDNSSMTVNYINFLEIGENLLYGQFEVYENNTIYLIIFKTRDVGEDIPIFEYSWDNIDKLLEDKNIDNYLNETVSEL